jgi:hypothetical protein
VDPATAEEPIRPAETRPGYVDRDAYEMATTGRRVSGWLLDLFFLFVVVGIVAAVLGGWQPVTRTVTNDDGSTWTASTFYLNELWSYGLLGLFSLLAIPMWVRNGATPAQRLLGLRVFDAAEPRLLSWPQATVRWIVLYGWVFFGVASVLTVALTAVVGVWQFALLIGLARDEGHQGRHDRLAHSLVAVPRVGRYSAWD